MQTNVRRTPHKARGGDVVATVRRQVFALVRELGIADEQRREIAGQFRADGVASMVGMSYVDMERMRAALDGMKRARWLAEQAANQNTTAETRQRKRAQHRRVDGAAGDYAAPRALYYLREQAEILWGADWTILLHGFIKRQTGFDIFWDSRRFPRDLHHQVTEGVLAQIRRAARDSSTHGECAAVNARRRAKSKIQNPKSKAAAAEGAGR